MTSAVRIISLRSRDSAETSLLTFRSRQTCRQLHTTICTFTRIKSSFMPLYVEATKRGIRGVCQILTGSRICPLVWFHLLTLDAAYDEAVNSNEPRVKELPRGLKSKTKVRAEWRRSVASASVSRRRRYWGSAPSWRLVVDAQMEQMLAPQWRLQGPVE